MPENGKPWWTCWLVLGGRGAGKTRAGAEWVRAMALGQLPFTDKPAGRIALVGESLEDVRAVMVEGVSGLLAVHSPDDRPIYHSSRRLIEWPNGAVAQIYSAGDPESLRGPQFHVAWCDELCKWRYGEQAYDMLQFGLRLGDNPRQVVTTTPRPGPLLKRLMKDKGTVISRAGTAANAANLAPAFLNEIVARYQGTRLGRQELDAEILEGRPDALWQRSKIESLRVDGTPPLKRIVVAIDPPVTSGRNSDACGIVCAGLGGDGRAYILEDETVEQVRPLQWAQRAVSAYHRLDADCLVVEVNQGGELVESVIRQVDAAVAIRQVRATRGKWLRAEPVAALYERGLVAHVGTFPELEDQLCEFGPDGLATGASPDRLDALVWALTELQLTHDLTPRVRWL